MVATASAIALLNEIRTTLGTAISAGYIRIAPEWSLYELYTFCLTIEEAEQAGAMPAIFCNSDGSVATSYNFRTRPGRIAQTDSYTYALLNFTNKQPLEVHLGVYVSEKSMERIQCDVCVLHKSEADFFRLRQVRKSKDKPPRYWPDSRKVILAAECKYLQRDMGSDEAHEFVGRRQALHASHFYLVTNTLSQAAGHRVLASLTKKSAWQHEIVPSSIPNVNRFRGILRQAFDDYISDTNNVS